jgi:hypothetical protein
MSSGKEFRELVDYWREKPAPQEEYEQNEKRIEDLRKSCEQQ